MRKRLLTLIAAAALILPTAEPLMTQKPAVVQAARRHKKANRKSRRTPKVRRSKNRRRKKAVKKTKKAKRYLGATAKTRATLYQLKKKRGKITLKKTQFAVAQGHKWFLPSAKKLRLRGKTYYEAIAPNKANRNTFYVAANQIKLQWLKNKPAKLPAKTISNK